MMMQAIGAFYYVRVVLRNRLCAGDGQTAIDSVDVLINIYLENTDDAGSNFKSKPF